MKCVVCGRWSFKGICWRCQGEIPLRKHRRFVEGMAVYSFYAYSDVEFLLHYKYSALGKRIFEILCLKAMAEFDFYPQTQLFAVGIDDDVRKGYSHTGVMLQCFGGRYLKPIYGELLAKNRVSYAGQSLQYRQTHPKGFESRLFGKDVVIFDDVVTTGTSLAEAKRVLEAQGNRVCFALVLCDAGL